MISVVFAIPHPRRVGNETSSDTDGFELVSLSLWCVSENLMMFKLLHGSKSDGERKGGKLFRHFLSSGLVSKEFFLRGMSNGFLRCRSVAHSIYHKHELQYSISKVLSSNKCVLSRSEERNSLIIHPFHRDIHSFYSQPYFPVVFRLDPWCLLNYTWCSGNIEFVSITCLSDPIIHFGHESFSLLSNIFGAHFSLHSFSPSQTHAEEKRFLVCCLLNIRNMKTAEWNWKLSSAFHVGEEEWASVFTESRL